MGCITVPSVEPEASLPERMDATSLHLEWVYPSLEELRGFLESYVVVFEELNTYQCLDLDPQTSQTRIVREPEIVITGLLPGKEYCVEIAAKQVWVLEISPRSPYHVSYFVGGICAIAQLFSCIVF